MCEWLSHGEWCDVKLLCGGRSFNAHRAVLASVSTFLRQVLLSCPDDATPTFIVLPDFDLDALSSVLFYIYNGEVILQKHKLELFLDIVQAMQIYIDCKYLPEEVAEDKNLRFKLSKDENALKTQIFALSCGKSKDQRFINVKRGAEIQKGLLHNSLRDTEFHDNVVRYQNESELRRSRLGNLKLPLEDRQRNSFLRDLFIETYPRNGNVNGLTEGVLAISNEYYHSPTSVLSANANGTHLGNDHSLAGISTQTYQQTLNLSAIIHSGQIQFTNNNNEKSGTSERDNSTIPCINNPSNASDLSFVCGRSKTKKYFPIDGSMLLPQQSDNSNHLSQVESLDFQQSFLDAMKYKFLDTQYTATQNFALKCGNVRKRKDLKSKPPSKVIFNQVLENPWNPRKPINFKPSQRICEKTQEKSENFVEETIGIVNDSNNNQTPKLLTVQDLSDVVTYKATKLPEIRLPSPLTIGPSMKQNCYKCTHCDQVFTSSESLAVHLRRHLTNARYTCGECGKTFSQLRNFKYHMSIHRGTREFAATCTVCGKYFNDRGYLSSHMKIHRNRKEYKCTLCPKSFNQRVAYNMHVRIHTGVKPHVCAECGKAFSRKMLLKQHQRTHSGERPYACPHCDKRFADRSNMTLHLRLHTGVKPFSCTLCPKSFTKKHHLKSHLNFHTGSKPYACPRCNLAFTQSSNMRTHYKKCIAPDHVEKIGINMDVCGNHTQSNF